MSSEKEAIAEPAAQTFAPSTKNEELHIEKIDSSDDIQASDLGEELVVDNILADLTLEEAMAKGRAYAISYGLDPELFAKGAAVARSPKKFGTLTDILTQEEIDILQFEQEHKWRAVPKALYMVIAMCSMAAAVQGVDEAVNNGANLFWPYTLGLGDGSERSSWLIGLVTSAPYLCCAFCGCWLTAPMNEYFGRKLTIFLCCFISLWTCFWQGFCSSWYHLFVARFFLGFGIGPKSSTVPIYAAETTPANIRGALVMMWQLWTAFGIMIGDVFDLAFFYVDNPDGLSGVEYGAKSHKIDKGLNWRLMLASALIPAIFVCLQVYFVPESPRWLMGKNRHTEAFESYNKLRIHPVIAARDCFYQYCLFVEETAVQEDSSYGKRVIELFTIRRNRNATIASCIVFFLQQFCGINVIAYYSSSIFTESGFSTINSLVASWGFGMVNTVFALPAVFTIDTFGRKFLLLSTFPLMGCFLLVTGFAFWIPTEKHNARVGVISMGIYVFSAIYSIGEGPVPFTYGAEVHQLKYRNEGMSLGTATTWFFNFVLSVTWPSMLKAFKPQGAFGWYAAWNFIGFILVAMFMRETRNYTLEELDYVFDVPMSQFSAYEIKSWWRRVQIGLFRRNLPRLPPLHATHMEFKMKDIDEKAVGRHLDAASD